MQTSNNILDILTIDCVWVDSKKGLNKFIRLNDGCAVVDHVGIKYKLTNSDVNKESPSDFLISIHIINTFKYILRKNQSINQIIYTFSNLNEHSVDSFMSNISEIIKERDYVINLVIVNDMEYDKEILSKFNTVRFIEI